MGLVDSGVDDSDLDARAGIALAADQDRLPGALDVAETELVFFVYAAGRHHGLDARHGFDGLNLLRGGPDEHGVHQVLDRSGDLNVLRLELGFQIGLNLAEVLAIGLGGGSRVLDFSGKTGDYGRFVEDDDPGTRGGRYGGGAGHRSKEEKAGER